ncbi:helix-turn-helix domain-containing protein [Levilactobacillus bambusae]|uniref:Helix-turn-helix domain-containing protein n=1 Tax=Levilactobacillus bambusae TaxID=2024736 RepID=A0A2V1N1J6_9LACO|nr:helix-turn-helix domain-containing protein [Levilactobacillus bambusae]PWG00942.1 hypothetical protein DCM90_01840 [Levilactobacillus bambusae]
MHIDLNDPNILSAKEAAQIWGKNDAYVRTSIYHTPEKWPKGTYRVFGKQIVVTAEGMEAATGEHDPRNR